jgi:hypothetical protein
VFDKKVLVVVCERVMIGILDGILKRPLDLILRHTVCGIGRITVQDVECEGDSPRAVCHVNQTHHEATATREGQGVDQMPEDIYLVPRIGLFIDAVLHLTSTCGVDKPVRKFL